MGKIADAAEIEVNEDEINSRIAQMAQQYNRRPEKLKQELAQEGSLEQVAVSMREEKALDLLIEQAEITEMPAEEFDKKHNPAAAEGEEKAEKKTAKKAAKKKTAKKAEKADEADDAGDAEEKKPAAKKTAKKTAKKKTAKKAAKKSDASSD
jgi:trigger factor